MDDRQEALVRWILDPISEQSIARREAAMLAAAGIARRRRYRREGWGGD